MFVDEIGE